jgi:hypothetical protein
MTGAPRLSAILLAPEAVEHVATTVRHLAAQTVAAEIELVLVTAGAEGDVGNRLELGPLAGYRVVELPAMRSNASGYAAGVRAATAPVVVLCEDHSYPDPGWAEALLGAYEEDIAAVGPVVRHAGPGGKISWADHLIGYGPWLDPTPTADVAYLPGHNSSYRRDVLLAYEPELETWLEAETVLHWDLRRRGLRLRLESRARTNHFGISRPRSWLAATFLQSRAFAGRRTDGDGPTRRLLWTLATPLIPAVRLRRGLRNLRRCPEAPPVASVAPALVLELLVSAAGEAVGYALGAGSAPQRVYVYEYLRTRHVNARDRAAMAAARFWQTPSS